MSIVIPSLISEKAGCVVNADVFGKEFNEALVHQLVVCYLAGGRSGTKSQKTRSEVSGGGAKPWKQKGSGRARAGTTRSPLWRTGGVTFAAKPRNFSQKLNKKMYRAGLRAILSELLRQGRLQICEEIKMDEPKTRAFVDKLNEIGFRSGLIILDKVDENTFLSSRNVPCIRLRDARSVTPVDLIGSDRVIITEAAVKAIEGYLL